MPVDEALLKQLWSAGWSCTLYPPCSPAQIAELSSRAIGLLNHELPEEYLHLLRVSDGFECNGGTIYSSSTRSYVVPVNPHSFEPAEDRVGVDGIVDRNLLYRDTDDEFNGFVVVGHSDGEYFCLNSMDGSWVVIDRGDVARRTVFRSFAAIFRERLPTEFLARAEAVAAKNG